jgi:hypothetical protein
VVDDGCETVAWESEAHTVILPDGLEDGAVVELHDEWMVRGAFIEIDIFFTF